MFGQGTAGIRVPQAGIVKVAALREKIPTPLPPFEPVPSSHNERQKCIKATNDIEHWMMYNSRKEVPFI